MREIGRVIKVERGMVTLALESKQGCSACTANSDAADRARLLGSEGGCPVCAAFTSDRANTLEALNRRELSIAPGDRVVIYLDPKKTVMAAFFLFVLPLIAFVLGYAALALLGPGLPDEARIIGGTVGFALAYVVAFIRRLIRKTKDWPEVVEKCAADEREPAFTATPHPV
jgi:positive regulator of sigma E activity